MGLEFKKLTKSELLSEPKKELVIKENQVEELIKIPEVVSAPLDHSKKKDVISSNLKDNNDHSSLRHGRRIHEGTDYSMFIQSPPMLYSRDGHNMWLGDMYRGSSAFLICNGPSFGEILKQEIEFKGKKRPAKEILNYPGFITMGINNGPKSFRPNLWTCVDSPTHFMKSIWLDPKITKFAPFSFPDRKLFDNENWKDMNTTVGQCPNVVYYKRNEKFDENRFLFEDTFNWGNHKDYGGGRSVMLVAMRLLYHLGIRTVFLLGADLKMDDQTKYHFDQDRSKGSINGNNSTYKMLNDRFSKLKPVFEQYGFKVFNCNLNSNLQAFPKIKFEDAIEMVSKNMPIIETERTEGLYDREANTKNGTKAVKENRQVIQEAKNFNDSERSAIKKKLDDARTELNKLKDLHKQTPTEELNNKVIAARKVFRDIEAQKNKIWGIIKK